MGWIGAFVCSLVLLIIPKADVVWTNARDRYAVRGPGRITWIELRSANETGAVCTVRLLRIGHVYKLEDIKTMNVTVNPGEKRSLDFFHIKEWLGNDFDKYESLDIEPNGCASVGVSIQRGK